LPARGAAFGAARPFGSDPKRSLGDLAFAADFNDLDMALQMLRATARQRIGCCDYATDGLKK
jgi:hypothetical protein